MFHAFILPLELSFDLPFVQFPLPIAELVVQRTVITCFPFAAAAVPLPISLSVALPVIQISFPFAVPLSIPLPQELPRRRKRMYAVRCRVGRVQRVSWTGIQLGEVYVGLLELKSRWLARSWG